LTSYLILLMNYNTPKINSHYLKSMHKTIPYKATLQDTFLLKTYLIFNPTLLNLKLPPSQISPFLINLSLYKKQINYQKLYFLIFPFLLNCALNTSIKISCFSQSLKQNEISPTKTTLQNTINYLIKLVLFSL
jgi:hypothetical protein